MTSAATTGCVLRPLNRSEQAPSVDASAGSDGAQAQRPAPPVPPPPAPMPGRPPAPAAPAGRVDTDAFTCAASGELTNPTSDWVAASDVAAVAATGPRTDLARSGPPEWSSACGVKCPSVPAGPG